MRKHQTVEPVDIIEEFAPYVKYRMVDEPGGHNAYACR
jgi:hypothetical protein